MTCCGCVQNRNVHAVLYHFQHTRYKKSRIQNRGFAWFQIHFHIVFLPQISDDPDQPFHIIILTGDVMSPAQIEPLHSMQILAELLFKRLYRHFQSIGILFAERVEMQPVQHGKNALVKIFQCRSEPGTESARIIDLMPLLGGALRIYPESNGFSRVLCPFPKPLHLRRGIEYQIIRVL